MFNVRRSMFDAQCSTLDVHRFSMIKRRKIEVFSLSFLDCLCCGFGAILLLFLLSIGTGPHGIESTIEVEELQALQATLDAIESDIRQKSSILTTANESQKQTEERNRIQSTIQELESTLADLQQEFESRQANLSATQKEAAEKKRILTSFEYEDLPPIGLPAESTHVAFVIDTSGSMRNQITGQLHFGVVEQIREILDSLPEVDRIQFLDTSGNYMTGNRSGIWLPDTPALRRQILNQLVNYPTLSVSDPEPGVRRAIRDLKPRLAGSETMSIYMLGDDFRGNTQNLLLKLDRLNPRNPATGKRPVSISAIGFPTTINLFQLGAPQGNARFANLMRQIAEDHDGVLILKPRF